MSEAIEETNEHTRASSKRGRLLLAVVGAFASAGIAYGAYWIKAGRYVESTEDAYVDGDVVQITSQVAGTVVGIDADDTQHVTAGQTLVALDRVDANVALERAEADLADSVREVRGVFARTDELSSEVAVREVDLAKARRISCGARGSRVGAVSAEEVQRPRRRPRRRIRARCCPRAARGASGVGGRDQRAAHPKVARATAALRGAYLDYRRADIPAPVSGAVPSAACSSASA